MDKQHQDEVAYHAFRESNDAIFVIESSEYRVIDLNPAALRLTSFSRRRALTLRLSDLFTADEPALIARLLHACAETGIFQSREDYKLRRADHGTIAVNVSVSRIHNTSEPLGLVVVRDVNERRMAQDQLNRFFNLSPALFAILDKDGRIRKVNEAWQAGVVPQPDLNQPESLFDYVHVDDREPLRKAFTSLKNPTISGVEGRLRHKDGTDHWYSWNIGAAADLYHAVATDVTEHKRFAAMEQSKLAAEAANVAKGQFLAHMSHEFRTPLTAILALADVLRNESITHHLPSEHLLDLETIKRNGDHLLSLINDILDLSKIERGKIRIELTRCDPKGIVSDIITLMKVTADNKQLRLNLDLGPQLPATILTDEVRLRQILINLLGNAIKFTDEGTITVRLTFERGTHSSRDHLLHFDVVDQGIGMMPETLEGLFQPFQRSTERQESNQGGAGLGLVISKRLTEMLGGTLNVESEPKVGSTFRLTIPTGPLEAEPAVNLARPTRSVSTTTNGTAKVGPAIAITPRRVLLAEDNADNRRAISMLLSHAGHKVSLAANGQEAFDLAQAAHRAGEPFDTIFMDMQMPVVDGFQATRMLREAGYKERIVALTAYAMSEDRDQCLSAGCDSFLSKPIDWTKLNSLLNA